MFTFLSSDFAEHANEKEEEEDLKEEEVNSKAFQWPTTEELDRAWDKYVLEHPNLDEGL
jgi:hypothetical protein